MAPRNWTNGGGTPLSADNLNALEAEVAAKITSPADPNGDRILFWDDSANAWTHLTASTGLSISGTTLTVAAASETVSGRVELATAAETATGTDATRAVSPANLKPLLDAKSDTIPAATSSVAGTMSAADKAKLDGATGGATGSTLALRYSDGRLGVATPSGTNDAANKSYVDAQDATAYNKTPVALASSGSDLDTFTTPGFYHQAANNGATTGFNYPVPLAGLLEVFAAAQMVYQRYTEYNTGLVWVRAKYSSTWYGWKKLTVEGHTHTDATGSVAGFMPAADKTKLDAATSSATPSTLVERAASGNFLISTPTATGHAATKFYVDSMTWDGSDITSGTIAPARIANATAALDGLMPKADKALLDGATAASTNGTIAKRDNNGNVIFGAVIIEDAPTAATHATRKDYVDAQIAAVADMEYSDDVPQETIFDVNSMGGQVGAKINVPTHISNPGETTHPSVLFFPDGWGSPVKWKYWMAHTPYPGGNDDHEDPSIAVSNNGISWQVPAGVTNPLVDADGTPEYHSDVDLKMGPNNTMYMFYRWYANVDNGGTEEKLRYMTTTDGVNWSAPVDMYVNDHNVRRLMSPSLVYEDGGWTMWAVDILPSPNRVVRTRSTGATPNSGWATPTNLTVTSQAGKEPWHIFVMKMGGKYFSLLNDCVKDQNGVDGDLLFMQSYDGSVWETSTNPVIPRSQAGLHEKLYRATMVPAFDNGVFGFRVWYAGWVSTPSVVWNLFRTFLKPMALNNGAKQSYAPLQVTGFTNTGQIITTDIGTQVQMDFDIRITKATGTLALSTAYATIGTIMPTQLRVNVDAHTRYWAVWLVGAGFNIHANLFINFYTGQALIRLQSGTASMVAGVSLDLTATIFLDKALLP